MLKYRISFLLVIASNISFADFANSVSVITASNFSAFNELLIVEPSTKIQLQFPYAFINPDYATTTTATGGTATAATNLVSLTTTTTSGSSAILASNHSLHYFPGQGSVCVFTAIYTTGIANNRQFAGIGNSQDGFFFGYNGTSFGILWYYNSSLPASYIPGTPGGFIPQTSWNVDKLDGTGPSGVTLIPTDGNVYKIQFQWLGFGIIKFYVENSNDGSWILVNQIQYPNTATAASLLNPSLPLYAQNINTGTTSSGTTLKICCMAGISEGKTTAIHDIRNSFVTTSARTSPTAVFTNVLAIKNNTQFNSVTNQISVYVDLISLYNSAGATNYASLTLYLNPTMSGALTFTPINAAISVVSQSTTSATVTSGTKPLITFYADTVTAIYYDMSNYNITLNPGDVLVVAAKGIGGSATMWTALTWHER